MIFGADAQNKNLKKASSKRIDTTPRTKTSNKLAARVASSKKTDNTNPVDNQRTVSAEPRSSLNNGVSDPIRGSFEGLMSAPSAVIQMNNTGYANSQIQTARYKVKKKFQGLDNIQKKFEPFKKYDKINRYGSITAKNSSANKLNSKLTIEKMFR